MSKLYKFIEASKILGCSKGSVNSYMWKLDLKSVRIEGDACRRIRQVDLETIQKYRARNGYSSDYAKYKEKVKKFI